MLGLILAIFACTCQNPPGTGVAEPAAQQEAAFRTESVQELDAALKAGGALVDVRTAEEYADGHVPGAVNIPLDQLGDRLGELPKDKEIHVICHSGNRSLAASQMLVQKGYTPVNVKGGTSAWKRADLPVE